MINSYIEIKSLGLMAIFSRSKESKSKNLVQYEIDKEKLHDILRDKRRRQDNIKLRCCKVVALCKFSTICEEGLNLVGVNNKM